ncbi:MAG TPA: hypothetical protein VF865_01280 [Acidobacteriaceae bacterium]
MSNERIERELTVLREGGQRAELAVGDRLVVLYLDVPTGGARVGLPMVTDVIVPVPSGYPANLIDLAGLTVGSPFLGRVKGGQSNQGVINAAGRQWQLASYHPHTNGGGPPWDQNRFGFHTYLDELIAWLDCLN